MLYVFSINYLIYLANIDIILFIVIELYVGIQIYQDHTANV